MAEVRNNWEGRTVNGVFPLRRFLGSSNHSSVFLTESSVEGFLNAAIKIVPADPVHSQVQLWQWKTAATFSHPNLMRLLDSGQCEIDGEPLLFVVMEYAEESLSQILPYRALAPDEVQELLVPTLDALAFLHNENWIQGQLKPSNFLVVDDQLKLAVDTIRPIGVSQMGPRRPSIYDAPESDDGFVSVGSDIWALGVTMTEALTQYPPTWLAGRTDPPTFPTNLPAEFAATIQRCLSVKADDRPTVAELQIQTRPGELQSQGASSQGTSTSRTQTSRTQTPPMPTPPAPAQASSRPPARPSSPPSATTSAPLPSQPMAGSQPDPGSQPITRSQQRVSASQPVSGSQPGQAPQPSAARPQIVIPPAPAPAVPPPIPVPEIPMRADRPYSEVAEEQKRSALVPMLFALVVVGGAIWGGIKLLGRHVEPQPTTMSAPSTVQEQTTSVPERSEVQEQSTSAPERTGAQQQTASAPAPTAARDQSTRAPVPTGARDQHTSGTSAAARSQHARENQSSASAPDAMARANTPSTPPRASLSASEPAGPAGDGGGSGAVHEEIPNVSARSRSTIHGHVRVAVKVTVDSSGRVIHDVLDNASSSNYFNRVASEAARKWRFATAAQKSREWLLRFEFGREGTTVKAVGPRS